MPLPLVRANLTFLGVTMPPGTLEVAVTYRPSSVRGGLLITGLTLVVLALAVFIPQRRRSVPAG